MKSQITKEGLIEARVNQFANISQKIKDFIIQKSSNSYTPFYREQDQAEGRRTQPRAKRSLTDWRQLYNKNQYKINPKNSIYNATTDSFQKRCSVTGQCQRIKKAHTTSKANTTVGQRHFLTSQSKRVRNMDSKRQSLIDFALAQTCYEKEIFKDQKNLTAKQRKFYQKKKVNTNRLDIAKVGQYLSNISEFKSNQVKELNATEKFIKQLREFEHVKMMPYNLAKIKEKCKIDNARYMYPFGLFRQSRGLASDIGLRYYERA